jgi:hypothetical protein
MTPEAQNVPINTANRTTGRITGGQIRQAPPIIPRPRVPAMTLLAKLGVLLGLVSSGVALK